MALIKCPECGREISDKSKQCIHCGCPSPMTVIKREKEKEEKERKKEEKKRELEELKVEYGKIYDFDESVEEFANQYTPKVLYDLAWNEQGHLKNHASAFSLYQFIIKKYPESKQAEYAKNQIEIIKNENESLLSMSYDEQKRHFIDVLDRHQRNEFNDILHNESNEDSVSIMKSNIVEQVKGIGAKYNTIDKKKDLVTKLKDEFYRNKKKSIAILSVIGVLLLVLIICIASCESTQSSYSGDSDYSPSSRSSIESRVPTILYLHLSDNSWSTKMMHYDIGSTKYNIGTINEKSDGSYEIKGTFSLYDNYGSISSEHYDERFEMRIEADGTSYCSSFLGWGYY